MTEKMHQFQGGNSIVSIRFSGRYWGCFPKCDSIDNFAALAVAIFGLILEAYVSFSNGILGRFWGWFWGQNPYSAPQKDCKNQRINLLPQHKRKSKLSLALHDQSWLEQSSSVPPWQNQALKKSLFPFIQFLHPFCQTFSVNKTTEDVGRHGVNKSNSSHFRLEDHSPKVRQVHHSRRGFISGWANLVSWFFWVSNFTVFFQCPLGSILGPILAQSINLIEPPPCSARRRRRKVGSSCERAAQHFPEP